MPHADDADLARNFLTARRVAGHRVGAHLTRWRCAANESRLSPTNGRLRLGRAGQPSSSNRAQPPHAISTHRGAITPHRGGITAHGLTTISLDLSFTRLAAARRIHDAAIARERAGLSGLAVDVTCRRGPRRTLEAVRRSQDASALAHRGVARCFRAPSTTHRVQRSIPRARTSLHQAVSRTHGAEASIHRVLDSIHRVRDSSH
jgi:hypothetical protein